MKSIVWSAIPVLLVSIAIGAAHAQETVQIETLEPVRCTQGGTGPVNMVEAGFSEPGVYGGDVLVHWFGMENEDAILEYRIPVAATGPQQVLLGLARSWDYGVYQPMVNGADAGEPLDLASGAEPERVFPAEVDLGVHDLQKGGLLLGMRFVGESPRAQPGPNPGSVGIDYVKLLPATTGGGPAGLTFELEKLQILTTGEGATGEVDLVEAGLASARQFGANAVVHWFGMENPGAALEFKVPVAAAGRYRVTIGVVQSWDYGLYQCTLDGKNAGPHLDLASGKEPEHVYPLAIDLGTYDLKRPQLTLGFRFLGASPNAQEGPNPMSGGFDWVRLTPAAGKPGPKAR